MRPLEKRDRDMILPWRNDERTRAVAYTDHVISPEEHRAWFERVRTDETSCCLVLEGNSDPLALVHFAARRYKKDETIVDIAGLRTNSHREMTPSCCGQHIGKGERLFLPVPRSRTRHQLSCAVELPHEPEDYEGVSPVREHRSADNRKLSTALRSCLVSRLVTFDAPAGPVSLNDVGRPSLVICVEEHYVAVTSARITTQYDRNRLLASAMIPKGRELIDHQLDLFSVAQ